MLSPVGAASIIHPACHAQYTDVVRAASIDGQALVEKLDSLRAWRDVGVPVVGHIVRLLDARDALVASDTGASASETHSVTATSHHDMWTVRGRLRGVCVAACVSLPRSFSLSLSVMKRHQFPEQILSMVSVEELALGHGLYCV